jgi:hypothetical protein
MTNQIRIMLCSGVLTLATMLPMPPQAGLSPQSVEGGDLSMAQCPRRVQVPEICVARQIHGAQQTDQVRAFIEGESVPDPTTSLMQCTGEGHDCRVIATQQGPETPWNDAAPGQTYRGCAAFTDATGRSHYLCSPLLAVSSSGAAGENREEEVPEPLALDAELQEEVPESLALDEESLCPPLGTVSSSAPAGESPEEEVPEPQDFEEETHCSPLLAVSSSAPAGESPEEEVPEPSALDEER